MYTIQMVGVSKIIFKEFNTFIIQQGRFKLIKSVRDIYNVAKDFYFK